MHLTDRQMDRFFDLLDGLIIFANAQLRLVDSLSLPIVGEEAEMKAAYVCDGMWRHPEVVDEYVRLNPNGLRKADLDAVAAWKDALVGRFTLVRFERGRAILMNEAGMFAVAGLDDDPEKRLTQCPDMVIATLLPFEGVIISDGLMYGDGIPLNAEETLQMQADLAAHESEGVAWTAEEFAMLARAHNEKVREREFDELMSSIELEARQSREGEQMPEGWHRGKLAGLSEEEREKRVKEYLDASLDDGGQMLETKLRMQSISGEPVETLEECLAACLKRDEMVRLCKVLGITRYGNKNKKALATMLAGPLTAATDAMLNDLTLCSPEAFELFGRLVKCGGTCEDALDAFRDYAELPEPLRPYVYQFRHDGMLVSVIPQELRAMAGRIDLEALAYERDHEDAVLCCAEAMGEYYGMLTLREAYDLYCGAVVDAYSLEDFVALLMREDSYDDLTFVLQQWNDESYLMHYSVSDKHLTQLIGERYQSDLDRAVRQAYASGGNQKPLEQVYTKMQEEYLNELKDLDAYRKRVVEMRARTPRRPLDAAAAEGLTHERFFSLPAVVQLRDFYDAHVPDGEDDYTFAERAVEDLVTHAIDLGNVDAYLDAIERVGWNECAEDSNLLSRLVENAYGALPSWEFNGWSPQEILENMSGRKVFYNTRGELLHPAPTDACPCGSGKPYRDCHGK
ncbi:MAG: SEC-C domain-containing protein [Coriobacteriia bacterium]|nr:SEC-C domain-containing protein [Coriobacteriia bacterium]